MFVIIYTAMLMISDVNDGLELAQPPVQLQVTDCMQGGEKW